MPRTAPDSGHPRIVAVWQHNHNRQPPTTYHQPQVLSSEPNNRQAREDLQHLQQMKAEMAQAQQRMVADYREQTMRAGAAGQGAAGGGGFDPRFGGGAGGMMGGMGGMMMGMGGGGGGPAGNGMGGLGAGGFDPAAMMAAGIDPAMLAQDPELLMRLMAAQQQQGR